jgi:V/A-type H+-transporting ATPase subunit A
MDALSSKDRLTMETAKIIREDFLHQNAFDEVDTYTSLKKQLKMLKLIYGFYDMASQAIANYAPLKDILACTCKDKIGRAKYIPEKDVDQLDDIYRQMTVELTSLAKGGNEEDV